jgi:two-component system, chemotaxis family, sensor kinase CheA
MNEFVEQFLLESRELVAQATDDLMALEDSPGDRERLDGAFRAFHTLKGAAGIVEFAAMARTLHAAEDILAILRSSEKPIASNVLDECLACLDLTSRWLDGMQAGGETPPAADVEADDMIARLVGSMDAEEDKSAVASTGNDWLDRLRVAADSQFSGALTAMRFVPDPEAFFKGEDPLSIVASLPGLLAVDLALTNQAVSLGTMNTFSCNLEILAVTKAPVAEVRNALRAVADRAEIRQLVQSSVPAGDQDYLTQATSVLEAQIVLLSEDGHEGLLGRLESAGRTATNTLLYLGRSAPAAEIELAMANARAQRDVKPLVAAIERVLEAKAKLEHPTNIPSVQVVIPRALRVDMDRIDALVNLTGELLVVKNAIGHLAKRLQDNEDPAALASILRDQHALFDRLATQLQGAVLRTRVLPLRTVFRRFPRLVREIAGTVGKTVRLVTEGEGTEADATIVDALFEPLLHVLRNAVDHGIESSERRATAGKPAMGTLVLRGRRDAENVVIEVEDDGVGIDVGQVRSIAAARGIASDEALAAMTDGEVIDLIFAAGFSTATAVTDLSGRGVGMDSVRTAVERLGGKVTLQSRPGMGTVVSLILPFSLMMTRLMTVEVAGQAFGVPLDNVVETTIVDRNVIVPIGSGRAFVLRDRTIPLIDLADLLGLARDVSAQDTAKVVIVSVAGQIGGLEAPMRPLFRFCWSPDGRSKDRRPASSFRGSSALPWHVRNAKFDLSPLSRRCENAG